MLDPVGSVRRVYATYDELTTRGKSPRIVLMTDIAKGASEGTRRRLRGERTTLSAAEREQREYLEGHAAIGAATLGSAFLGGVGEPDTTLVARGGPRSIWLLQNALAGWETGFGANGHRVEKVETNPDRITKMLYRGRLLRCGTALFPDEEDRTVVLQGDGTRASRRGVSESPPPLSMPEFEKCIGKLDDTLRGAIALGLLDTFDPLVEAIVDVLSSTNVPIVVVDTETRDSDEETRAAYETVRQIAAKCTRAVISVSGGDLEGLRRAAGIRAGRVGRSGSDAQRRAGELTRARTLADRIRAPVLFHSDVCAALIQPDGTAVATPTFDIQPEGGTNGAGDTFNAAYMAGRAAMRRAARSKTLPRLDITDCLVFACAVSGARLVSKCYPTRENVVSFSEKFGLRGSGHRTLRAPATRSAKGERDASTQDPQLADMARSVWPRARGEDVQRVVLVDLDHTLFPSDQARERAGAWALRHLPLARRLTEADRIQLFRFVYKNERRLATALSIECNLRLEWNREEFYLCAAAVLASDMDYGAAAGNAVPTAESTELPALKTHYQRATSDLSDEAKDCVKAFNIAGYTTYPGVRGALDVLAAMPHTQVYCMVEGRVRCQLKKLRVLGLSDIVPQSRLLVDDRMIVVDPRSQPRVFDLGSALPAGIGEEVDSALDTVRREYAKVADMTQISFRAHYLAAIGKDRSAPGPIVQAPLSDTKDPDARYRLRPGEVISSPCPMKVAVVGDRPDPELTWFGDAVDDEVVVGLDDAKPTARLYRVMTGAYSGTRTPCGRQIQEVADFLEAAHLLSRDSTWEAVSPVGALRVPDKLLAVSDEVREACKLVVECRALKDTAACTCAKEVLVACGG